jgi:hypothetical protein
MTCSRTRKRNRGRRARGLLLCAGLVGCVDGFDPPSELSTLRVMAVRPEPASGSPGAEVRLDMLLRDATVPPAPDTPAPDAAGREPQIVWLGGCHNPPTRQYYACLPYLRELAKYLDPVAVDTPTEGVPPGYFGVGPQFQFTVPEDILSGAPRVSTDPVHYGVSYVFFAVCAGKIRPRPDLADRVPLDCVDRNTGKPLGSRDFVLGFTTVFSYEGVQNSNPTLLGAEFGPTPLPIDGVPVPCSNHEDCAQITDARGEPYACSAADLCSPTARRCVPGDCPAYRLWPQVDPSTAETVPGGNHEIVWANFYATAGEVGSDTQLVSDRKVGLLDGYASDWKPPETAGTVRFFITLNDQRGGAAWTSFDVVVR